MTEFVMEISEEDSDTLLQLYKKVLVLKRISQIKSERGIDLSNDDVSEINIAELEIDKYWSVLAEKYKFPAIKDKKWTIDFYSNKIFITD